MWDAVDSNKQEHQPIVNKNLVYSVVFILLLVIVCLLFLNLFVGVVIETFNKEKEKASLNHLLQVVERQWIQVQILAYSSKPKIKVNMTGNCFRDVVTKFTINNAFDSFIMICIFLNTAVLAIAWYGEAQEIKDVIEIINYVFMAIFTVEAILKLIALKCHYFKDSWNIFDFVVVIGTGIILIISRLDLGIDLGVQSTILRSLRIGRIFRIVKRAKKLQIIFQTLVDSLPSMASLGVLLILLLFLYAIIGISQFSMITLQEGLNHHANFQDFVTAFLLLMRASTGEAWNMLMFDAARSRSVTFQCDPNASYESIQANGGNINGCGSPTFAIIYFLSFQVIVSQIFLNLFIAIIIDSFIIQSEAMNMPINPNDIDAYSTCWMKYDCDAIGFIQGYELEDFFIDLSESGCDMIPFKNKVIRDPIYRRRMIANLEIPSHKNLEQFMYYDVLVAICKQTCMNHYNRDKIQEKKEKLRIVRALKGVDLSSNDALN